MIGLVYINVPFGLVSTLQCKVYIRIDQTAPPKHLYNGLLCMEILSMGEYLQQVFITLKENIKKVEKC